VSRCHGKFFVSDFFHESSSPQAPENNTRVISNFFQKFAEIFASQGAPLVSKTPVANFATSSASVIDIGGKFLIEDFFHLPTVSTVNDTGGAP
jgi:hypothetical protein